LQSSAIGAKSYTGIAKIMKAYIFSIAADVWGDVPYHKHFKADAGNYTAKDRSAAGLYTKEMLH